MTNDPLIIAALLLQAVVPAVLLARLALATPRDRLRAGLDAAFVALYLVAIALAGLWLVLPRWTVGVYGLVLVWATARAVKRAPAGAGVAGRAGPVDSGRPRGGGATARSLPWIRMGAVACAAAVGGVALAGRRPLPGPAVALALPVAEGAVRVVAGGSNTLLNPHLGTLERERARPWRGQSYAVDLVGVGAWGSRRSPTASSGELDAFAIFGTPLLAPCAGRVVRSEDGQPDLLPPGGKPASLEGNHVILACGNARVVLAHMARGSVAVAPGDSVVVGDLLGRVGNSGSSDEPHLHIHAQTPGTDAEPLAGAPIPVTFGGRQPVKNEILRAGARPRGTPSPASPGWNAP